MWEHFSTTSNDDLAYMMRVNSDDAVDVLTGEIVRLRNEIEDILEDVQCGELSREDLISRLGFMLGI